MRLKREAKQTMVITKLQLNKRIQEFICKLQHLQEQSVSCQYIVTFGIWILSCGITILRQHEPLPQERIHVSNICCLNPKHITRPSIPSALTGWLSCVAEHLTTLVKRGKRETDKSKGEPYTKIE